MELTWPAAVAIIGTVASGLLALIKIMSIKDDRSDKAIEKLHKYNEFQDERSDKNRHDIQHLNSEVSFLHSKVQAQAEAQERLEDLLIKLLTGK